MKTLFWVSFLLTLFTYAGYPACLYLRARLWPKPVVRRTVFPKVSIIIALHNEERYLKRKLENLAALIYAADHLETILVSDGSSDQTNAILREWQGPGHRSIILETHAGKANALNCGVAAATGEIICFTDARQMIAADGLTNLISNFADPSVGCASGELMLAENNSHSQGVGLYWRVEKLIRQWEGLAGSTVGATGGFYAVRRKLIAPLPAELILDDVFIPLQVARQNHRVIFDSSALASDDLKPSAREEFRRKVRTLAGNYQLLRLAPWLLTRSHPLRLSFFCHKLLRLFVPFALVCMFVSCLLLHSGVYELALALQIALYALAFSTIVHTGTNGGLFSRLSNISLAFVMLNTAAGVAFIYFITGKKALWAR